MTMSKQQHVASDQFELPKCLYLSVNVHPVINYRYNIGFILATISFKHMVNLWKVYLSFSDSSPGTHFCTWLAIKFGIIGQLISSPRLVVNWNQDCAINSRKCSYKFLNYIFAVSWMESIRWSKHLFPPSTFFFGGGGRGGQLVETFPLVN